MQLTAISALWNQGNRSGPPAPPPAAQTLGALGYVGTNGPGAVDYYNNQMFVHVLEGARGFEKYGINNSPATTDAAGWPTEHWQNVLSVNDGNMTAGTYLGRWQGASGNVICSGATLTETGSSGGFVTFNLVVGANAAVILSGVAGVTNIDIVRPGYSVGSATIFPPDIIAFYAESGCIRTMKMTNIEFPITDGSYAALPTVATLKSGYGPVQGTGGNIGKGIPHERLVAFFNAIKAVAGSKLKYVWVNIQHNATDACVTSLGQFYRDNLDPSIIAIWEVTNEPWNYGYVAINTYYLRLALVTQQAFFGTDPTNIPAVTSITGTGSTATIVFAQAHGWGANASTRPISVSSVSPGFSVDSVTATITSPTSATYPCTGSGSANMTNVCVVGLPGTNLCFDGTTDVNLMRERAYAARVHDVSLLLEAVYGTQLGTTGGTRARMTLEQQCVSSSNDTPAGGVPLLPNGRGPLVLNFLRAVYTTRAPNTYVYSVSVAPYPALTNAPADGTTLSLWQSDLNASQLNYLTNIQSWVSICSSYGITVDHYEDAPTLQLGWGDNATNVTFQNDASMAAFTQKQTEDYADSGVHVQCKFSMVTTDWAAQTAIANAGSGGGESSGDSFGWQGTDTHTTTVASQRPRVKGWWTARNHPLTLSQGQNVVGGSIGASSTVLPKLWGRQDDFKETAAHWSVAGSGAGTAAGNVGFLLTPSTTIFPGQDRWLEITIMVSTAGTYTLNLWGGGASAPNPAGRTWQLQHDGGTAVPYVMTVSPQYQNFTQWAPSAGSASAPVTLTVGLHVLRITCPVSALSTTDYEFALAKIVYTRTA